MLTRPTSHQDFDRRFRFALPAWFNMGTDVIDRWAAVEPDRPALIIHREDGSPRFATYGYLSARSNRLANALKAAGIQPGDRIGILLPQSAEALIAHVAAYKLGAIAVPLAILFGSDALSYRLRDAGVAALVTTVAGAETVAPLRTDLPDLRLVLTVGGPGPGAGTVAFADAIARASDAFDPEETRPDDAALMIYTSGTTGPPKGALHGHRVLLGHMPGIQLAQEGLPRPGDVMWTPSDWAWAGGLLNALLPALYVGVPVVAFRFEKFDPERAVALMIRHRVTNAFLPPTALKMIRGAGETVAGAARLHLRAIGSAGERLGRETCLWAQEAFGVPVNEFYGQTECNAVIGSSAGLGVTRPGAIGKPIPGHDVVLLKPDGSVAAPGEAGEIAISRPDPVMFLGYWNQPEATAAKFRGDHLLTGDQGIADEDGYISFVGRDDDLITSAGYRIGPGEIEDCLGAHPAVAFAAVVGKPDPVRTQIVKAFVVLKPGVEPDAALADAIKAFVRGRLSAHEYPREIAFVDEIPLTTTGKVIRRAFRDKVAAEAAGN
ncbi:AMP-binding protein [Methylobrevis albus]|uniref:AMP-binding protein n=1 Tax=Methylobrevis albus TaxID=2793297 RepID=A0A931MYI1_9HYPH|nr:AMP-binding protein [Methylobrevis albus]MBH0238015.1 AMP-binding protein [Methylobrevis albus]